MASFNLLLGAGFSRNWGGWLASEAFEYLIGSPLLQKHPGLIRLLWKHRTQGGFEAALAEIQAKFGQSAQAKQDLDIFQSAVKRMFADMNAAFLSQQMQFEFNNLAGFLVRDLLVKFDAIFTLNQDLLLERHYLDDNIGLTNPQKWGGGEMPGIVGGPPRGTYLPQDWENAIWQEQSAPFGIGNRMQPIFKLHGSSQWRDLSGSDLLLIGGGKSGAIARSPLLTWYHQEFRRRLSQSDARLMIIGYGFADSHINAAILDAEKTGLKIFIIDPLGVDVSNPSRGGQIPGPNPFESMFMGASRRNLSEIFGSNRIEHSQIVRFFAV